MTSLDGSAEVAALAAELARVLEQSHLTVAVAESLTGGALSSELSAAPNASRWFRGGLVAYAAEVKQSVLGVPPGPVVTTECAEIMAQEIATLLRADISVAVTGVGGPGPEEGQAPGTVCWAVWTNGSKESGTHHWQGDPQAVVGATTLHALQLLIHGARQLRLAAAPLLH